MKLWRCPKCKRRLPERGAVHVCQPPVPLAAHFRGKGPVVRKIFNTVRAAVRTMGPVVTDSTKTRIAFAVQTIFLELTPQQGGLRGCLVLGRRARNPRFTNLVSPTPGRHYHFFKLTEPRQLDARLRRLLAEAYRVVGHRQRRTPSVSPQPTLPVAFQEFPSGRGRGAKTQPLWQCPKCGRWFVTRNLWHSCARVSVGSHFRGKDPRLRRLFNRLVAALRRHGPLLVNANKTRISFQARMRFAGVQVQKDALLA
ncbi:MAG: hypothetical protein HY656_08205, partial [Acidobacteria bacterium]|nr:hypothetical protein [Acidobacteriota bacterium]